MANEPDDYQQELAELYADQAAVLQHEGLKEVKD